MKPIGGFFELELSKTGEYYPNLFKLNSGRNAFEAILRKRAYKKVFLPYYTCDAMLEPIERLGVKYHFYHINEQLEPETSFEFLQSDEVAVYNNYFGIKYRYIQGLNKLNRNIIIDNCQAFFSEPDANLDTFYSPRKFFGVPDGGYLFLFDGDKDIGNFDKDHSYEHFLHLVKRIDLAPEEAYDEFLRSEQSLINRPGKAMSEITRRILQSINYKQVFETRRQNFNYLHQALKDNNLLKIDKFYNQSSAPMVYPFLIAHSNLRAYLISKKVFVATYWPNVLEWTGSDSLEHYFAQNLIPLPIDQRYRVNDMDYIVELINQFL